MHGSARKNWRACSAASKSAPKRALQPSACCATPRRPELRPGAEPRNRHVPQVGATPRHPANHPDACIRANTTGIACTTKRVTKRRGRSPDLPLLRSEEHTSELQSLMRISYAVFCLKKNTINQYH